MPEKDGTATALAVAMEHYEEPDEPEQLDLLGLPEPATEAGRTALAAVTAKRGPGRPPGARNKRTLATVEWLLGRYQDPRAVLLAIAQTPVAELAARLNCTAMEALQEKRLAAAAVLPFVAQRQPLAVDVTSKSIVYLTINDGLTNPTDDGGIGLTARVVNSEQNQSVIEGDAVRLGHDGLGQSGESGGKADDATD